MGSLPGFHWIFVPCALCSRSLDSGAKMYSFSCSDNHNLSDSELLACRHKAAGAYKCCMIKEIVLAELEDELEARVAVT